MSRMWENKIKNLPPTLHSFQNALRCSVHNCLDVHYLFHAWVKGIIIVLHVKHRSRHYLLASGSRRQVSISHCQRSSQPSHWSLRRTWRSSQPRFVSLQVTSKCQNKNEGKVERATVRCNRQQISVTGGMSRGWLKKSQGFHLQMNLER